MHEHSAGDFESVDTSPTSILSLKDCQSRRGDTACGKVTAITVRKHMIVVGGGVEIAKCPRGQGGGPLLGALYPAGPHLGVKSESRPSHWLPARPLACLNAAPALPREVLRNWPCSSPWPTLPVTWSAPSSPGAAFFFQKSGLFLIHVQVIHLHTLIFPGSNKCGHRIYFYFKPE